MDPVLGFMGNLISLVEMIINTHTIRQITVSQLIRI